MPVLPIHPLVLGYTQLDEGRSRPAEVRNTQPNSPSKLDRGQDDVAFSDLARELSANLMKLESPASRPTLPG